MITFAILQAIGCPRGTMTFASLLSSQSTTKARLCTIYLSVWPPRICAVGIEILMGEYRRCWGWSTFGESCSGMKPSKPSVASDLCGLAVSSDAKQGDLMSHGKHPQTKTAHSTSCLPTVLCCKITHAASAAPCENPRKPSNGPSSSIVLRTSSWASMISAADGG